jgi:hypothetical protein
MPPDKINDLFILNKYQALLIENDKLKIENKKLQAQLEILNSSKKVLGKSEMPVVTTKAKIEIPSEKFLDIPTGPNQILTVNQNSKSEEKIDLFMSLFKGREDVYAKKWQNKKGESGYSPVCFNEWKIGICNKPKIKCSECANKNFENLNRTVIEEHLRGNIVVGIYPLQFDDTSYFLAMDFDDEGWEKDISILRSVCTEFDIHFAIERSRSGNGAHVWFFFEERISAALARKFGTALLTYAMNNRH